jgi:pantothenate kinase-related protein Tda10
MSTEQLEEELETPELDEAEEEEIEHPYLDTIEMMDKTERMNKLRSLVKYSKSEEWKKVKKWAKDGEEILKERIKSEAYNRVTNEKKASVIDERVLYVEELTHIAEKVDNEVFKDYLLRYQVNGYESFVMNKTGHIFLSLGTE